MRGRRHDPDTQISTSPSKVLGFSSSRRTFAAEPSRTKTARAFAILFAESRPIGFRPTAKCKLFPAPHCARVHEPNGLRPSRRRHSHRRIFYFHLSRNLNTFRSAASTTENKVPEA